MYVGLKQPRGDGERYVTPARAAAKETTVMAAGNQWKHLEFTSAIKIDPFALLNRGYPHKHFSQYLNSLDC